MPPPKSPPGFAETVLVVTVGLLLPGALAGQQPVGVPVPSLDGTRAAPALERSSDRPATPHTVVPGEAVAGAPIVLDAVFERAAPGEPDAEDGRESLGSLGDVLPRGLCRDLLELRDRIQRFRTVLFGQRGILRWGDVEGSEGHSRIRLNLQADPHPGLRVTLITR